MYNNVLYIKKITDCLDKNGKVYFKLVLSKINSTIPPAPWDDECHLFPDDKNFNLQIFKNSGHVIAWFYHDMERDDYSHDIADCPINISGNFYAEEAAYIVREKYHLYTALGSGSISEGYWLSGEIIGRKVKPYVINGTTANYYTIPILWDDLSLTDEQKEIKITREFAWKGRPLIDEPKESDVSSDEDDDRNWHHYNNRRTPPRVTNADAFDDPSDYWNID